MTTHFPPRIRGHLDSTDGYNFCYEQWDQAPFRYALNPEDKETIEFISLAEHEHIVKVRELKAKIDGFKTSQLMETEAILIESNRKIDRFINNLRAELKELEGEK